MIAEIERERDRYELVEATLRCGDFCDSCGDCLHCSHGTDYCDGRWVLYRGIHDERIAEIDASRAADTPSGDRYSMLVRWSEEDGEFVATCAEWPGVSALGPTREDAAREFAVAMDAVIAVAREDGQPLPVPIFVDPPAATPSGAREGA